MNDFNARDLFAALAMCGLVAHHGGSAYERTKQEVDESGAMRAYEIADAMIKEKEKRDGGESKA